MLLRPPTDADAAAGARLQMTSWREAYAAIVDPVLLDAQLADETPWVERWARPPQAGVAQVVAEAPDGTLVGFARSGPGRHEGDAAHELYALYVLASQHGTGVGQALLDAAVPPGDCSLWVLEPNARARAFYARNGFVPDGGRKHNALLDSWEVRLWRA